MFTANVRIVTEQPNPERHEPPFADPQTPAPGPEYPPPGPAYPPYAGQVPYAALPPRAKNPALKIVLIVLAGLLVLCCIGGGIGGFFIYRAAKDVVPARDATRVFIKDLQSGDSADAFNHLCASTKSAFAQPVFNSIVAAQPKIIDFKFVKSSIQRVNGQTTATVTADLNLDTGRTERHTFSLAKENGKWLVCGTPY